MGAAVENVEVLIMDARVVDANPFNGCWTTLMGWAGWGLVGNVGL